MLFSRVYNAIKYGGLPPSIVHKNRLFIEKDARFKKIHSNLGLTFRNSKWSGFYRPNVGYNFFILYRNISYMLYFLLLLLIGFSYSTWLKFYIFGSTHNFLFFFVWELCDQIDYSITWLYIYIYYLLNTLMFVQPISAINRYNRRSEKFPDFFLKNNFRNFYNYIHDHKLIIYNYVSSKNYKNNNHVESLFDYNIPHWDDKLKVLKYSFKLSKSLNTLSETSVIYSFINTTGFRSYVSKANFLNSNLDFCEYKSLIFFNLISNVGYKLPKNSTLPKFYLNLDYCWTTDTILIESELQNYELENIRGMFNLTDLDYQNLNNLNIKYFKIFNLSNYILNNFSTLRINRWVYKYSILHSHMLNGSKQIRDLKVNINSGFLNSINFNNNLWSFNFFKKIKGRGRFELNSLNSMYYGPSNLTTKNYNFFPNPTLRNNKFLLRFYEDSYFFFLKRFYMFNSLKSNKFNVSYNLESPVTKKNLNRPNPYTMFINYLNKHDGEFSYLNGQNTSYANMPKKISYFTRKPLKAVYLDNVNRDFLDINYLDKLYPITANYSLLNRNTFYYYSNRAYLEDYNQLLDNQLLDNQLLDNQTLDNTLETEYTPNRSKGPLLRYTKYKPTTYISINIAMRHKNFNTHTKDLINLIKLN